ncbi:ribosomal biogenesis factor [Hyperolius riggenbachi]|uniref:ribosomal biogenesis factor n=1 Tax=Hyperolius riggenbachi TaxID=752182 RepID=UPI0035A2C61C
MAKNKGKKQKQSSVFHIANTKTVKAKNKAKPVKSSLKRINVHNSDKVRKADKVFTELHKTVTQLKKTAASHQKPAQISKPAPKPPADVDKAADLFSQL